MLETLNTVPWQDIAQPKWNPPNEVPDALRTILRIDDEQDAKNAYNRLLFSVGNNHAGTYYPVVLWVIPFLAEMLLHPNSLVRKTRVEVLVDLVGTFEPEQGFTTFCDASGKESSLQSAVRDALSRIRPVVEACASRVSNDSREHALSLELLSIVR
jgi:hypothetical protein